MFQGAEDYQALLMEKETLLAELRSENLTKDAENRKLQRRIKRTDQELNDLNLEREKMEKELDEAQLQKSRSDKTINVIIIFFPSLSLEMLCLHVTTISFSNKFKFLTGAFLERQMYLLSVQKNVARKTKENSGT